MVSGLLASSSLLFYILLHACFILLASNTTFGFANETDNQALLAIKNQIAEDPFQVFSWNDSIQFCNWKGVTCSRQHHQRVTVLNLSSLELVGSLSPHIGNLTFLREIYLENNNLHDTIPQEIGRLFRLQNISLGNNFFQGEFPINLTRCLGLRVINLAWNNLVGRIPIELGSFTNLLLLDLTKNHFIGNIPPSLGNLSSLRVLLLDYNNLEGSIPFELGKLSNLVFSIEFQQFVRNDSYPALQYLVHLFLCSSGSVPMNLGSLLDLKWLNINNNRFGNEKANTLSFLDSLTNCTNLGFLDLGGNYFGGVLPNSIANLSTNLTILQISQNYLSGSIPRGIENLVNLKLLALDGNMFTGSIPESIGKLSELEQLFISANNISGKIPSSIGNMSRLSILGLG
ncbi:LRR receptor-like serine/threonine-protein kinase EFR [Cornus florida]|uniref:LRR receptor-like serine/threonine-protein kinase EFR n=1 Tax=Cornus florida TaxID=4283 RepID=UPI00289D6A54|nr:LRR receptor-like serine/threonine-protein kinase EFR [Cornus florida]